ncbi:MAG TPA: cell division protein ZapA [Salinivirgaceae bacterium]|nr:cell division protein ZapA [Salinivirgaceae bacterium]
MDNENTIKVNIAERYYPLKIMRADEEKIISAAKRINDAVLQYKKIYVDKDNQDFLAMAALQFVSKLIQIEEKTEENEFIGELEKLNYELDNAIDNN